MSFGRNPLCRHCAIALSALCAPYALAQVVTDGTVGPAGALNGPSYDIRADLGRLEGSNLFHSFSRFDVGVAEVATFSGPPTVASVIARITGPGRSVIDGTLRATIAGADLYLLNPNGVFFGAQSALDIGGSLHVSSADFMTFADGVRFDAAEPSSDARFTVEPPEAFGFRHGPRGAVTVSRTLLAVQPRERVSVIAGNVVFDGGVISAPGGEVRVEAVQGEGLVPVRAGADAPLQAMHRGEVSMTRVSVAQTPERGLIPTTSVDTMLAHDRLRDGGRVSIRAGRLVMTGGGIRSGGGDVDVRTGLGVSLSSTGRIDASRDASGVTVSGGDRAGSVHIRTAVLSIADDSQLASTGALGVASGTIALNVQRLEMRGDARVQSDAFLSGNAGQVIVDAREIDLDDRARISARAAFGEAGDGGQVSLLADTVSLAGDTSIDTSTSLDGGGAGGLVSIRARSVRMEGLALLFALSASNKPAGSVEVRADELVMVGNSAIAASALAEGRGGRIDIEVGTLGMSDASVITSGTEGTGPGGDITITLGAGRLSGQAVISSESEGDNTLIRRVTDVNRPASGGGAGGQVSIAGGSLTLADRAQVISATAGEGRAGNIGLRVGTLDVSQGARIAAISQAEGLAGNIDIAGGVAVTLSGGAIATSAESSDGGNVTIEARDLVYLDHAEITTSVGLKGDGGNIDVDPVFVVLNNSRIVANANEGDGGNIRIVAENFISDAASDVSASSNRGVDGNVSIQSPEQDIADSLSTLAAGFLDASALVSTPCGLRTRAQASSLIVPVTGAVLPSPDDLQPASVFSHWAASPVGSLSGLVARAPGRFSWNGIAARPGVTGGWSERHDCSKSAGG